jgi:SNF2 family DNA or RNA helicase
MQKFGIFDSLRCLITATCLRRTKANYSKALDLPQKYEFTESVDLDDETRELYNFFKRQSYLLATSKQQQQQQLQNTGGKRSAPPRTLVLIGILRLICNHGEQLLPEAARAVWSKHGTLVDWNTLQAGVPKCDMCGSEIEGGDAMSSTEFACQHTICDTCACSSDDNGIVSEVSVCPGCQIPSTSKLIPQIKSSVPSRSYKPSAKVTALLQNLANDSRTCDEEMPFKR